MPDDLASVLREQRQRLEILCDSLERSLDGGEIPSPAMLAEIAAGMRQGRRAVEDDMHRQPPEL